MTAAYTSPTCAVYTSYDTANPPEHPGPSWTRFVCISDTHSQTYELPLGDVLLHSGDLTAWGYFRQMDKVLKWLESLPHPTKIIIAGNHDLCLDKDWVEGEQVAREAGEGIPLNEHRASRALVSRLRSVKYLEYDSISFRTASGRTWEVYGSPAVPRYAHGAFQYVGPQEAQNIYANIPPSTEILLTHGPPYGICDLTKKDRHAGCKVLASRMDSPDLQKCKLHVFGHIHEARGASVAPLDSESSNLERVSVNAAMPRSEQAIIVDLLN